MTVMTTAWPIPVTVITGLCDIAIPVFGLGLRMITTEVRITGEILLK